MRYEAKYLKAVAEFMNGRGRCGKKAEYIDGEIISHFGFGNKCVFNEMMLAGWIKYFTEENKLANNAAKNRVKQNLTKIRNNCLFILNRLIWSNAMENIKTTGIKKYLPNIATLIRLFGSFSLLFVMNSVKDIGPFKAVPWVWLIIYLFLVFTDTIDGTIARKFNVKSDLGAFLDAFSDTVLLVIAAATVFVKFASDNLTDFQTWLYIGLLIFCSANKLSMNLYAKKFFGVANMLHSYPQKAFAVGCYIGVGFWAFIRDVPWWSVVILIISNLYGAIDEIVYCARAASYDVDFKGHGFQKYEKRAAKK